MIYFLKNVSIKSESDKRDILNRMAEISLQRYLWIQETSPSITEILNEYPVYFDVIEIVRKQKPIYSIMFS